MKYKIAVLPTSLPFYSDFCYNIGDFLDVLNHLPNDSFYSIIIVVNNRLYRFEYYTGNITAGKVCDLFALVDYLKKIEKGEI